MNHQKGFHPTVHCDASTGAGAARRNTGKKTNGGRRGRRTNGTTGLSIKEKKVKQWSKANTAAKVFYCFVFAVVSSSMFFGTSIK